VSWQEKTTLNLKTLRALYSIVLLAIITVILVGLIMGKIKEGSRAHASVDFDTDFPSTVTTRMNICHIFNRYSFTKPTLVTASGNSVVTCACHLAFISANQASGLSIKLAPMEYSFSSGGLSPNTAVPCQ